MFEMELDVSKGKTQAGFMKKPKKSSGGFMKKCLHFPARYTIIHSFARERRTKTRIASTLSSVGRAPDS